MLGGGSWAIRIARVGVLGGDHPALLKKLARRVERRVMKNELGYRDRQRRQPAASDDHLDEALVDRVGRAELAADEDHDCSTVVGLALEAGNRTTELASNVTLCLRRTSKKPFPR
jgi:hypothetical protein